jgi:hypothetical protein
LSWAKEPIWLKIEPLADKTDLTDFTCTSTSDFIKIEQVKDESGEGTNMFWCTFQDKENPNWNNAFATIVGRANDCYETSTTFTFGPIKSDGVVTLDAAD